MENFNTGTYDMYKDISARTNGEIYIGVIGAVRTGKSSFIKRFMELMVLPLWRMKTAASVRWMKCHRRPREKPL